jgi:hypothetical protein
MQVDDGTLWVCDAAASVAAVGSAPGADSIDDTMVDWGTGAGQVSGADVPIADAGNYYGTHDVEAALQTAGAAIHAAVTLDGDAAVLLDLSTQEIGLDVQDANKVFAGPTTGAANEPTFRALVAADVGSGVPDNTKFLRDDMSWQAAAGGAGDMTYAVIQACQLINEIKGWPPNVPIDSDLVTLNLWWDDAGSPTTKATVVDVAGEAGITETYELALKCAGDGAGDGFMQRYTYADEPRLKVGRVCSAILAIWSVSAIEVTAKLLNSDASETAAAAVAAAAWTIVKIENHTLAGTHCDLQVTAGAAGTFYVVPLGMNIGTKAFPLRARGLRYVETGYQGAWTVNGVDLAGASWTDADFTSVSSSLTATNRLLVAYNNTTAAGTGPTFRRNGSADAYGFHVATKQSTSNFLAADTIDMACDDGQIIEYTTGAGAGDTEALYVACGGYWEWA